MALVCACFAQGAKTPPSAVVSWIVSPAPVVVASSTASVNSTMTALNTVLGKIYDVSPAPKPVYGEHDTPVVYVWPPPDPTKT